MRRGFNWNINNKKNVSKPALAVLFELGFSFAGF